MESISCRRIELERAIGKDWGIAAFYDVGKCIPECFTHESCPGRWLGWALLYPVGPIRLDVARQIGVRSPDFRIHLTLG